MRKTKNNRKNQKGLATNPLRDKALFYIRKNPDMPSETIAKKIGGHKMMVAAFKAHHTLGKY